MAIGGLGPEKDGLSSWVEKGRKWPCTLHRGAENAGWAQVAVRGTVVSRTLVES